MSPLLDACVFAHLNTDGVNTELKASINAGGVE